MATSHTKYLILSCDGGGIRGVMTAVLLKQLQPAVLKNVNLFAGTSTGGLIALGLAGEIPVDTLIDLYRYHGAEIFQPYTPSVADELRVQATTPGAADSRLPQDFWHVKYTNTGLRELLLKQYPQNPLLRELERQVLVTTFQLLDERQGIWQPLALHNLPHSPSADTRLLDAALSTSAAPIYFPPYAHPAYGYCVDGGVFANNPSMLALTLALATGVALDDIYMLSLGTGFTPHSLTIPPRQPEDYGVAAWLNPAAAPPTPSFPLIATVTEGAASVADFQCRQVLKERYRRANIRLTATSPLDDYRHVEQLYEQAHAYTKQPEWQAIQNWVDTLFGSAADDSPVAR